MWPSLLIAVVAAVVVAAVVVVVVAVVVVVVAAVVVAVVAVVVAAVVAAAAVAAVAVVFYVDVAFLLGQETGAATFPFDEALSYWNLRIRQQQILQIVGEMDVTGQ